MDPGELRNRITLQKKKEATGPVLPLDEYEDYKTIWAKASYLTGRTLYAARAANVKTDVEFIIRYRTDIDETMRVKYKGKTYEIDAILPLDNKEEYLAIKAHEVKHDM